MIDLDLTTLAPIAVKVAAVVAGSLVLSLLLSFLEELLVSRLDSIREIASKMRESRWKGARKKWGSLQGYWLQRQREFTHPIIVELARLSHAISQLQRPTLYRLSKRIEALRRDLPVAPPSEDDRNIEPRRADRAHERFAGADMATARISWVVFGIAVFVLVGMSAANFWMLRLFFEQVASEALAFHGVGRFLIGADVLAALFPVIEFGSGVLLHVFERSRNETTWSTRRFLGTIAPWIVLVALALVEMFAYAQLSDAFMLHEQFELATTNPMYLLARYFMAPFGMALTLGIAGLGYYVIEAWQRSRQPRIANRDQRRLAASNRALERLAEEGPAIASEMELRVNRAEEVLGEKMSLLGVEPEDGLASRIDAYVRELLDPPEQPPSMETAVGTPAAPNGGARKLRAIPNAAGQFGLTLVLLAAFVFALWLNARNYQAAAPMPAPDLLRMLIGYAVAGIVAAVGYALGETDNRSGRASRHGHPGGHALSSWMVYPVALATLVLSVVLALQYRVASETWWWSNAIYGFVLPMSLIVLSHRLTTHLQGAALVLIGAVVVTAITAEFVGAFASLAVELTTLLISWLIRTFAVPGWVMRRRPGGRPAT